jgi:hypothetical protein
MSRELVLIPKLRYETLIKLEDCHSGDKQVNKENSISKEVKKEESQFKHKEQSLNNKEIERNDSNKVLVNDEIGGYSKITHADLKQAEENRPRKIRTNVIKKITKTKDIIENQNGGGKSYISMKPKEFLNTETKKQTLQKKWLCFHM